ncbi:MAG: carboxypeptidase regulatory-like domain-containing protein [Phycisphaerae bacterium]|nr:carboxypeptidase regulatory-like domain-containing protein [Phycisphaerae bacterium]
MRQLFVLITMVLLFSGCAVPFPHFHKICGQVSGRVVDIQSGQPISDAYVWISYSDRSSGHTRTGKDGTFSFGPKKEFRRSIVVGATKSAFANTSAIRIDAQRYRPVRIIFPYGDMVMSADHYHNIWPALNFDPEENRWNWPNIQMQKTE